MAAHSWAAHYDAGVPRSLEPYPNRTLLDYLADAARVRPNDAALLFKGAHLSYATLERLTDLVGAGLRSLGIKRGDRIALVLPNCPQFLIAELGAWKIGAIVAPLNPTYAEPELEVPLRENGIETVVTLTRFYERVKRVQGRTPVKRIVATNIKEYFPPLLKLLFTIARERRDGDRVTLRDGDHSWDAVMRGGNGPFVRTPLSLRDDAVLLMSGGTTGTPKGVVGKHRAYTMTGLQVQAWMAPVLERGDVILLPLPLFHVYANVGVQSFALITQNPIALVPNPRDLADVLSTIRKVKPAFFNGVPTLYMGLLNHPDVISGKVDFKSIKICFSGAAPLLSETKQRFESITAGRIVEGYSLTEAMMALCVNPVSGPNKIGSVGIPLPDVDVRIVDAETGFTELPASEVGEICFSAPQIMDRFWNRPDETADVLRPELTPDGVRLWLHTGDLGYLDDDGYLFIVDRKKDLIKTSGYQVWPREVEEALALHPAVAEVGVAGVPDHVKGEAVRAWVVLRPAMQVGEADLRAFCRQRLAPYKVPGVIVFRRELPKTMVGKVLRRALKADDPDSSVSR
jgi:long-chain acyl-CoA synthetase